MNYILADFKQTKENLLPLTYFRPVGALRTGILTIAEKWQYFLAAPTSFLTEKYLQEKYPATLTSDNIYINAGILPDANLVKQIQQLPYDTALVYQDEIIAVRYQALSWEELQNFKGKQINFTGNFEKIAKPTDLFQKNSAEIKKDFEIVTNGKTSQKLSQTNIIIGKNPVFVSANTKIEAVTFNTEDGPVYIGENVVILEGSLIRGPFAALENSVVKMGAKIYGGTTLGPNSKVGGEIKETVFLGNANKGHDGYLGDSVIGEWCNLGAGTNNSNLKNNYTNVKMWHYPKKDFVDTGLQFCGLIMGDHSKCGIATMFNTGTVVGVSSNIFGAGFQPKFFPSFKWGGQKYTDYRFDKAMEVATAVMKRRNKKFDKIEQNLFQSVFEQVKEKE